MKDWLMSKIYFTTCSFSSSSSSSSIFDPREIYNVVVSPVANFENENIQHAVPTGNSVHHEDHQEHQHQGRKVDVEEPIRGNSYGEEKNEEKT
jgi:hypothetical protein